MPTLILSPRHTPNSQRLWKAAIQEGWSVERSSSFRLPDGFTCEDPVLYGEPLFNASACEVLGMNIDMPSEHFLAEVGDKWSGRWCQLLTVREARKIDRKTFFKPPNHKTFTAGIYESGEGLPPHLEPDEMILCQSVVKWISEFRFFVLNRKIMTESCYINSGMFVGDTTGDANEWHHQMTRNLLRDFLEHSNVELPSGLVIDVGIILKDDEYVPAIIEANEAPGSGMYRCDPFEVLKVLQGSIHAAG